MLRVAAALTMALIGTSALAETRYDFSYQGLYFQGSDYAPYYGFDGYFVADDVNQDGTFASDEVSDFVVGGFNIIGPQTECDSCYLYLNYRPGGILSFSASAAFIRENGFVEIYSYGDGGMKHSWEPMFSYRWETGPDTVITVTAAVPEPSTYAMLLGGLGVAGFAARRRRT